MLAEFSAAIYMVAFLASTVWLLVAVIRSKPVTPKEQRRADMRSLSWPSDGSDFNRGFRRRRGDEDGDEFRR